MLPIAVSSKPLTTAEASERIDRFIVELSQRHSGVDKLQVHQQLERLQHALTIYTVPLVKGGDST